MRQIKGLLFKHNDSTIGVLEIPIHCLCTENSFFCSNFFIEFEISRMNDNDEERRKLIFMDEEAEWNAVMG